MESISERKYLVSKTYRYGNKRYRKKWYHKKAKDKRGFMRYSTGTKWSGKYDPDKPAFWRAYQDRKWRNYDQDELLPGGYTRNQTWIALSKSWNGFLLAKRECDPSNMTRYIGQIRKLQKDLGLEQTEFEGYLPAELVKIDLEFDENFLMDWYGSAV